MLLVTGQRLIAPNRQGCSTYIYIYIYKLYILLCYLNIFFRRRRVLKLSKHFYNTNTILASPDCQIILHSLTITLTFILPYSSHFNKRLRIIIITLPLFHFLPSFIGNKLYTLKQYSWALYIKHEMLCN